MSRFSPSISRPEDVNCCFWDTLLVLAGEPAFEFLLEALSAPSCAPYYEAPFAETWEEAAPPGRARLAKDYLPHAVRDDGALLPDDDEGEWAAVEQAPTVHPPDSVGHWSLQALRLLQRSGNPTIWKMYNRGLRLFIDYRATVQMPSVWPIPGDQIKGFLLSLDSEGVAGPKIMTYLSGLSYLSQAFSFQDPLQDLFTSHTVIGTQWQEEPPIPLSLDTLESLLGALQGICSDSYEHLMFRALFLLSFHMALRPREMVAETSTSFRPGFLYLGDPEVDGDFVGPKIMHPEMADGPLMCSLMPAEDRSVCPVLALRYYLAVRPRGGGPLFMYDNWRVLCKRRFLEVFHGALRRLDLPVHRYCIRSFWLGSLTNAVRCHSPERIILHLARWPRRLLPGSPMS